MVPELVSTVCVLHTHTSREIIKAALAFVKVAIACLHRPQLHETLPVIVYALTRCPDEARRRFRSKLKVILQRLIRKLGYDTVFNAMPEKEHKLLVYLKKMDERKMRK